MKQISVVVNALLFFVFVARFTTGKALPDWQNAPNNEGDAYNGLWNPEEGFGNPYKVTKNNKNNRPFISSAENPPLYVPPVGYSQKELNKMLEDYYGTSSNNVQSKVPQVINSPNYPLTRKNQARPPQTTEDSKKVSLKFPTNYKNIDQTNYQYDDQYDYNLEQSEYDAPNSQNQIARDSENIKSDYYDILEAGKVEKDYDKPEVISKRKIENPNSDIRKLTGSSNIDDYVDPSYDYVVFKDPYSGKSRRNNIENKSNIKNFGIVSQDYDEPNVPEILKKQKTERYDYVQPIVRSIPNRKNQENGKINKHDKSNLEDFKNQHISKENYKRYKPVTEKINFDQKQYGQSKKRTGSTFDKMNIPEETTRKMQTGKYNEDYDEPIINPDFSRTKINQNKKNENSFDKNKLEGKQYETEKYNRIYDESVVKRTNSNQGKYNQNKNIKNIYNLPKETNKQYTTEKYANYEPITERSNFNRQKYDQKSGKIKNKYDIPEETKNKQYMTEKYDQDYDEPEVMITDIKRKSEQKNEKRGDNYVKSNIPEDSKENVHVNTKEYDNDYESSVMRSGINQKKRKETSSKSDTKFVPENSKKRPYAKENYNEDYDEPQLIPSGVNQQKQPQKETYENVIAKNTNNDVTRRTLPITTKKLKLKKMKLKKPLKKLTTPSYSNTQLFKDSDNSYLNGKPDNEYFKDSITKGITEFPNKHEKSKYGFPTNIKNRQNSYKCSMTTTGENCLGKGNPDVIYRTENIKPNIKNYNKVKSSMEYQTVDPVNFYEPPRIVRVRKFEN